MSKVISVTVKTFEAEVLQSPIPVLVDFWAEWCGPCRMIAPILDELAVEALDKIKIVKINADDESSLVVKYGVSSIPTLILFNGGEAQKTMTGARPKPALIKELEEYL